MATPTAVGGIRPLHRTAKTADNAVQGVLALDWSNAQEVDTSGSSAHSAVFDASHDRVVMVSCTQNVWITVGPNDPVAPRQVAGSMYISAASPPVPIYVPAGMQIAAIQDTASGFCSMVPALIIAQ